MVHITATLNLYQQSETEIWLDHIRHELQNHDAFLPDELDLPLYITLSPDPGDAPFRVYSPNHIVLSTFQLKGHARFTRLSIESHLLLYLNLALLQRKALTIKPLLIPEDLIHPPEVPCLMNRPANIESYALMLENLDFCPGCSDFYNCVSCENELAHLSKYRKLLNSSMQSTQSSLKNHPA